MLKCRTLMKYRTRSRKIENFEKYVTELDQNNLIGKPIARAYQ